MAQSISPHPGGEKTDSVRAGGSAAAAPAAQMPGQVAAGQPGDAARGETHPENFEAALRELEQTVARMESGELSLEQSLASYKRGALLLQYCQAALGDAQQQIKVLEEGMLKEFQLDERDQ